MKDISSEPWAQFAENFANEMINHNVTQAVVLTRSESEDRVVTNYYNCDYEMRWAFLGHMMANLVEDIMEKNSADDEESES